MKMRLLSVGKCPRDNKLQRQQPTSKNWLWFNSLVGHCYKWPSNLCVIFFIFFSSTNSSVMFCFLWFSGHFHILCNGVKILFGNSIYCLFVKPDKLCITMYSAMLLSLRDQLQSEKLLLLHQWHLLLLLLMMPIKREEMLDLDIQWMACNLIYNWICSWD